MILDQTFALSDIPRIFTLSFLELLLSADNAIVLGIITHRLAPHLRKKALYIGVISAFFFRAAGLLSLSLLLQHDWVQMFGAAYLLYLALNHFLKKKTFKEDGLLPSSTLSFWKTVLLIELFDLAFAIDSIVAGVAFISDNRSITSFHPKLWIVYFGGMLGLVGTRYAADLFSSFIDKFPRLETSAYLMIAWIGLKLGFSSVDMTPPGFAPLFWTVIVILFASGFLKRK